VGSLGTLASTTGNKEALRRTGEKPVQCAGIEARRTPNETILAPVEPLDVELLTGLDAIPLPEFSGQDDLAPGRNGDLRPSKISSLHRRLQGLRHSSHLFSIG
jgi:hypothetical protein